MFNKRTLISFLKKILGHDSYMEWRNAWLFGKEHDPVMLQELPVVKARWPAAPRLAGGPVILISPTQRSGSNYVHALLALHPVLTPLADRQGLPQEFFFHSYADALKAYVEKTTAAWSTWLPENESRQEMAGRLYAAIGSGLINHFAGEIRDKRPFLRAPDSRGIDHLFHLFPDASVILLFRDGRDTCASFMKSWGSESVFADFAQRWSGRVQAMLAFEAKARASGFGGQVFRLKYEDCVKEPEETIRKILPRLGLPESDYPFDEIRKLPLLGTSEEQVIHWNPVQKPPDFNPLGRWKQWPEDKNRQFDHLAGEAMRQLGYGT